MPDPNQDALSPEDVQALVHAQQQLYSAGDPRAAKLYNFITSQGYARPDAQGALQPALDLSNRQGQGVYQMQGPDGKVAAVPYGQVQDAAKQGFSFASDADKFRFAKDNAADPNRATVYSPAANDPRASSAYQDQMEANAPLGIRIAGGISKGAATLARPVLDVAGLATGATPQQLDEMTAARSGAEKAAKYGTVGGGLLAAAPAAISAPVETTAGLAAGALGAGAGQIAGYATGMRPMATAVLSDAMGLGAGAGGAEGVKAAAPWAMELPGKYFPAMFDGPPEGMLHSAIRPGKNNMNWLRDLGTAAPLMKSSEAQLGHPISGVDDAIQAAKLAKQSIWGQISQRLQMAGHAGATIDGNEIADAMVNSIDKRTAAQNPGLVKKIQALADTYRRPMSVEDAEDYLQSTNADLNSYYAKNKVSRQVAQNDPETAYKLAEGDALRDALYRKLDTISGPGAAQLKQAYGSLTNVEKELYGRQLIALRQNPVSLAEQLSTARGVGKIAKGILPIPGVFNPGDVAEGLQTVGAAHYLKGRNLPDALITRAFEKINPAGPFPAPTNPRFAGLLPRGPIQTPPPADASGAVAYQAPPIAATTRAQRLGLMLPAQAGTKFEMPSALEMTPDERMVSLLHYLRTHPQAALPAKASAIPLPPSFR